MKIINDCYKYFCDTISDINEHMPVLKKYSSECKHITELGVRDCVSTWAFLAGNPLRLVSCDILKSPKVARVYEGAQEANISFDFIYKNDLEIEIEETELLFIDTLHTYKQLQAELFRHGNKSSKYIILHDTTSHEISDAEKPPLKILFSNSVRQGNEYFVTTRYEIPTEEPTGLWQAILDFVSVNPHWKIKERFYNSNGLTVLERENHAI